jgi:hypothetical protein
MVAQRACMVECSRAFGICEDLGIEPDLATLPDECLGFTYEPPARDKEPTNAPDRRATSPP